MRLHRPSAIRYAADRGYTRTARSEGRSYASPAAGGRKIFNHISMRFPSFPASWKLASTALRLLPRTGWSQAMMLSRRTARHFELVRMLAIKWRKATAGPWNDHCRARGKSLLFRTLFFNVARQSFDLLLDDSKLKQCQLALSTLLERCCAGTNDDVSPCIAPGKLADRSNDVALFRCFRQ